MTLFFATLLVGIILMGLGAFQLTCPQRAKSLAIGMLRSKGAAIVFLSLATAWFLWEILHLGEPDFGNHKMKLFWGFLIVTTLSHFYVPDFLSVRGLAALLLLSSDAVLDAAYMEEPLSRLFLVGFIYVVIVCCMYLGSLPYRLRDFYTWLYKTAWHPPLLATVLFAYGAFLCVIAFRY
jgi:hypothetical protein